MKNSYTLHTNVQYPVTPALFGKPAKATIKIFVAFFVLMMGAFTINADAQSAGFNSSYAVFSINGGADAYYCMFSNTSCGANPSLDAANLGTFNPATGTLVLRGAEHNVFKCGGADITSTRINYRIYKTGSPTGSYIALNIGFLSTAGNGCGGQDQQWKDLTKNVNVLSGLAPGNYTIEIFSDESTTVGTQFLSNSGNNYKATFTINPVSVTATGGTLSATYASLAAAITAINGGTHTGTAICTVYDDYTETAPIAGYSITVTGSAGNTITFKRSNTGTNKPILTAFAPQASGVKTDAVIKIIGGDFITIDGFTIQENAVNTTTAAATNNMTEIGIGLWLSTATNGAQNNTIQNCTITLGTTYQNAIGIFSSSSSSSTNTAIAASATTGTNSNNKFYSNTISNVAYGMYFISPPVTATIFETGNDIGGTSSLTANTITFGNATAADIALTSFSAVIEAGIYFRNTIGNSARFNNITSNSLSYTQSSGLAGVVYANGTAPSGVTYSSTVSDNTINLTNTGTTPITGIDFGSGLSTGTIAGSTNNITINQTTSTSNSATVIGIKANYTSATNTCSSNTIVFNQNSLVGIANAGTTGITVAGTSTTLTSNSNNLTINQTTSGTGSITGPVIAINSSGAATTINALTNTILVNQTTSVASGITTAITGISATVAASGALNITTTNAITIKQAFTASGTYGSGAITYVDLGSANHGVVNVNSNTFNTTGSTIRSAGALNCVLLGSGTLTGLLTIKSNTVNIDRVATSGNVGFYNQTNTIPNDPADTISNNNITFTGISGSSALSVIQKLGGSITASRNICNNTISVTGTYTGATIGIAFAYSTSTLVGNNSITISCGSSSITGITGNSNASASIISGNTLSFSSVSTTPNNSNGISIGHPSTISNNTISNLSFTAVVIGGTITTGISASSSITAFGNTISGISVGATGSTGSQTVDGIQISGGTNNVYKNKIYGISTACSGSATLVTGIKLTGGFINNVYNNLIGGLSATAVSSNDAVRGIGITSTSSSTTHNIFYNSIYLNASSIGTNFGTSGIYHTISTTSTTSALVLRNNLIVNVSTAAGTGLSVAFRRSGGALNNLANYNSASNNNLFYAGTPGTANLIYYDGTSSAQTISAYKNGIFTAGTVAPRDAASVSENPTFISTSGSSASFLKINTAISTQIESGAANIATYTDDYGGTIRQGNAGYVVCSAPVGTAPDIGAWEFCGTPPATMTYTSSTAVQLTGNACAGATNVQILRMEVVTTNSSNPLTLTNLVINSNGTSVLVDVATYRVYSTGTSNTFATTTPVAAAAALVAGDITVTPSSTITLAAGTNYFWLVYNLNSSVTGPSLDGEFKSVTLSTGGGTPSTTAPSGNVSIFSLPNVLVNPISGSYCTPGGSAVAITASGASTYTWSPTTGLTPTNGASVSATPSTSTTYTVTGTDGNGCVNTATAAISVGNTVTVSASATPPSVCSGNNSQLLATPSQPFTTPLAAAYGFAGSTGTYATITGTTLGAGAIGDDVGIGNLPIGFTFNYNGTDHTIFGARSNGLIELDQATVTLSGFSLNALATTITANCIAPLWEDNNTTGGSIIYATTGTAPSRVLTVQWTGMHVGNSGNAAQPTIDMQVQLFEGSNIIKFIYGSTSAAFTSTTASIGISGAPGNYKSVTPLSPPNTSTVSSASENSTISSATNFPTGTTYTFTPSGAPVFTYAWSPPTFIAGQTALSNPVATGVTATTTYSVTVTGNAGCSGTNTATVSISPLTCSPATVSSIHCANTNFTVTANTSGGGGTNNYSWSDGVGGVYPNAAAIAANLPAGTYTFTCTITDACSSSCTSSVNVTVNAKPSVTVTPTPADARICGTGTVSMLAGGASTYVWSPTTALAPTTGTAATEVSSATTTTTYTVTGTDANGCVNTASQTVTVGPAVTMGAVSATQSTICSGETSALSASASLPGAAYCAASQTTGTCTSPDEFISNVTFSTINNSSTCAQSLPSGYTNYTSISASVTPGAYTLTVTNGGPFTGDQCKAWIDLNLNGSFTDPGEEFTSTGGPSTFTIPITIPPSAYNGTTRMRIRVTFTGSIVPCGALSYGETEDYKLIISGATNPLNYAWTPASGLTPSASVSNPTTPALTSTTTYTVTATEPTSGCNATGNVTVTVKQLSTPTSYDATACDSYSLPWGGSATVSGPYSHTYTNAEGCDSMVTANVTINHSSTPTSYSVTACDSYSLPWGGSATVSGPYNHTYTNAEGCDSMVTANVTINHSSTPTSYSVTACDSYSLPWGGSATVSGPYSHTYTNAEGCDSMVTANVTINHSSTPTSYSVTACDSYSLPWGGSATVSGPYSHTYTNAEGCDSMVTANVTINHSSTPTSYSVTACDSYSLPWGGSATVSGPYSHTYTNAEGCDSMVTANVTINHSSTPTSYSVTTCDSYSLPWGGSATVSGPYSHTYTNAEGCDSMVTANVTINHSSTPTSYSVTACDSYSLPWGGSATVSGPYSHTYTNAEGCDSMVTANVTINHSSTPTSYSVTTCDSYSLPWGGSATVSGPYSHTYTNAEGCDSMVTANVTINHSSTPTSYSVTACDSYSLPWGGSATVSGPYSHTYTNAEGCDSMVTANVTINHSSTPTSYSVTACDSYSLPWGGSATVSGPYNHTYTNAEGCDSMVTANVTINHSSTPTSYSVTACDSYSLPWGGSATVSGPYSHTYTNAEGCDSMVTANVTINHSSTPTSYSVTACDSYSLPWGGSATVSGPYSHTYTNAEGCDSMVTANVTINHSSTPTSYSVTACDSYSLPWGGSATVSGPYSHTYTNAEGCDSMVTANVTINHSSTPTSYSVTACDSYSLPWGGSATVSGPYSHTYTNAEGCDSMVTANVTINQSSTPTSYSVTTCDSYSLPWGGSATVSGPYSHTYTNAEGCDSMVTANVTINHSSTPTSYSVTACDSYSLPWGGSATVSGPYSHNYTNAEGCDSMVTANVTINHSSTPTSYSVTACDSYSLPWGGSATVSGPYSHTYTNAEGCDSMVTANVTINHSSTPTSYSVTACDSYSLPWGGSATVSGPYSHTYTNAEGCDSMVTANVTINHSSTPTSYSVTACDSYSLPWGGSATVSGPYSHTYTNAEGCDSMVTANVTINHSSTPTSYSVTACDSYSLPWGGSATVSGPYNHTYTNAEGCDSMVTANVTINHSSTPTSYSVTACDSYSLPWGGSATVSGPYSHTYTNAEGCDSMVTANVTINHSSTPTSYSVTACDSYSLPWGGSATVSGPYSHTYTNAEGCDSMVTANVTINHSSTPTSYSVTACDSYSLPWGGSATVSGPYSHTYTNAEGCDSMVTANVTINHSSTPTSYSVTTCDSYSLPWGGSATVSGPYSHTYTNAEGCDSMVTANVTINHSSTPTSYSVTACDSYSLPWGGSATVSGPYSHTYTNAEGCDSMVTANVTINHSSTPTSYSVTTCDSYSLPWGGSATVSGPYSHTYTNAEGCDSMVTANVTINHSSTPTSYSVTACDSYSLPWGGSATVSGPYSHTYTNAEGCDSMVTANVTINYSSAPTSYSVTTCDSYSLPWGGSATVSGPYSHTYTNAEGCDSMVTANVTINHSSTPTSYSVTACDSYSLPWGGSATVSGPYSHTYTNAEGCDSMVTANVTINHSSTPTSYSVTTCDSYSLPWGGSATVSGPYSHTYTNAEGCDSMVTANVTINHSSAPTSYSVTACDSYSLPWGGSATVSGPYSHTYTNAEGCDSMVTANVTINYSPSASITPAGTITECKGISILLTANTGTGLTYQWYKGSTLLSGQTNSTYTVISGASGKYKVLVTSQFGCSTLSAFTTVNRLPGISHTDIIVLGDGNLDLCLGQVKLRGPGGSGLSWQWLKNGNPIIGETNRDYKPTTTGNYKVQVTNPYGCSNLSPAVTVINSCKEDDITDLHQGELNMYPNPTDGHFMLHLNLNNEIDGDAVVQVYNSLGQSVLGETVRVMNGELLKEIWLRESDAAGMYFVRVIFNGQMFNGQVVYQH